MTDADELAKLATMHAAGSLTDDEFIAAKARLLGDVHRDIKRLRPTHRNRWLTAAAITVLIGAAVTVAIVASGNDTPSKADSRPSTPERPTTETTATMVSPALIQQEFADTFAKTQTDYTDRTAALSRQFDGGMTAEDFARYCSVVAPTYASWAADLGAEDWPDYAAIEISNLSRYYSTLSGLFGECAVTDPASQRMADLSDQFQQLVAVGVVVELDAAAALGWTACTDAPPPCFP